MVWLEWCRKSDNVFDTGHMISYIMTDTNSGSPGLHSQLNLIHVNPGIVAVYCLEDAAIAHAHNDGFKQSFTNVNRYSQKHHLHFPVLRSLYLIHFTRNGVTCKMHRFKAHSRLEP